MIDPTVQDEGAGVFSVMDKDYADYVKVVELINALDKYGSVLRQLVANKITQEHGKPVTLEQDTAFMKIAGDMTMSQLFPPSQTTIYKPNKN